MKAIRVILVTEVVLCDGCCGKLEKSCFVYEDRHHLGPAECAMYNV